MVIKDKELNVQDKQKTEIRREQKEQLNEVREQLPPR